MTEQRPEPVGDHASSPTPREVVDWSAAVAVGKRLVSSGPSVGLAEAADIVADLRAAAAEAHQPVADTSRLHTDTPGPPVLVVDRPGWIEANAATMAYLMAPVVTKLTASATRKDGTNPLVEPTGANAVAATIGAKVTGAEAGALLAFMAAKVLGQYDLAPQARARLLLVAPNIVSVERELDLVPRDFRRWVAMHEETHRVQFTAVPWLRHHMIDETIALGTELAPTPQEFADRLGRLVRGVPEAMKSGAGLAEIFATPDQRRSIARITAVMALLEGHADVVMDEVGPAVIPTVGTIRERFEKRRGSAIGLDKLIRRLMGMDAKLRQYRDGAVFVRGVQDKVGVDGFNAVWTGPENLPSPEEIADPALWVARVHG